jgi:fimbrial chaperone protein
MGDTEVALQADVNAWKQNPNGEDQLELTEDIILSPPILKLPPNTKQVVRLARLNRGSDAQLTYRLVVREVPEATLVEGKAMEIPISLALSIPVFVTSSTARRDVSCQVVPEVTVPLKVDCANRGNGYAQIREIAIVQGTASLARFTGGSYILPGATKRLVLAPEAPAAPGDVGIRVTFDDGDTETFRGVFP